MGLHAGKLFSFEHHLSFELKFIWWHACDTIWRCTVREQEVLSEWFPWFSLLLSSEKCFFENMVPACYGSVCSYCVSHCKKFSKLYPIITYNISITVSLVGQQCRFPLFAMDHLAMRLAGVGQHATWHFYYSCGCHTCPNALQHIYVHVSPPVEVLLPLPCVDYTLVGLRSSSCFLRAMGISCRWGPMYVVAF